jgi:hypothetical protein
MSTSIQIVHLALDAGLVAQDGPMAALQQALVARLAREPHYTGVPLHYENSLDILNEIDRAVDALGLCVVVMTPEWRDESPNIPYPVADETRVSAVVTENPVVNRSETGVRIPGGVIAWRLACDLARTQVEGAMLVHQGGRQSINEEMQTVHWTVDFQVSLNA